MSREDQRGFIVLITLVKNTAGSVEIVKMLIGRELCAARVALSPYCCG